MSCSLFFSYRKIDDVATSNFTKYKRHGSLYSALLGTYLLSVNSFHFILQLVKLEYFLLLLLLQSISVDTTRLYLLFDMTQKQTFFIFFTLLKSQTFLWSPPMYSIKQELITCSVIIFQNCDINILYVEIGKTFTMQLFFNCELYNL